MEKLINIRANSFKFALTYICKLIGGFGILWRGIFGNKTASLLDVIELPIKKLHRKGLIRKLRSAIIVENQRKRSGRRAKYGDFETYHFVQICIMIPSLVLTATDPVDILKQIFLEIKKRNPLYSLRAFSIKLGCTTSTISRIFSRKRKFTVDLAIKWIDLFELKTDEKKVLYLLVLKSNATSDFEQNLVDEIVIFYREKLKT